MFNHKDSFVSLLTIVTGTSESRLEALIVRFIHITVTHINIFGVFCAVHALKFNRSWIFVSLKVVDLEPTCGHRTSRDPTVRRGRSLGIARTRIARSAPGRVRGWRGRQAAGSSSLGSR